MEKVKMRRGNTTRQVDSKNVKLFELHGFEVVSSQEIEIIKRVNPPIQLKQPVIPQEVEAQIAAHDPNEPAPVTKPAPKQKPAAKRKPKTKANGTSSN